MLNKLFGSKEISEKEKLFFKKLSQYLIKNCSAVYGVEYIPRLVQKICSTINIDVELHKGILCLNKNEKQYTIPYAYNFYKGHIVDLGLFIVKDFYKTRQLDKDNDNIFKEIPAFENLPPYLLANFKEQNILGDIEITAYESKNLILNDNFQPTKIVAEDKLLLAVYNDCYAYKIATELSEYKLDKNDIKPSINFISGLHSLEDIDEPK